ncbi:hypothetical protein Dimus_035728 [Dionaea muscipula]
MQHYLKQLHSAHTQQPTRLSILKPSAYHQQQEASSGPPTSSSLQPNTQLLSRQKQFSSEKEKKRGGGFTCEGTGATKSTPAHDARASTVLQWLHQGEADHVEIMILVRTLEDLDPRGGWW